MTLAYPLQWPKRARTPYGKRKTGTFSSQGTRINIEQAMRRLTAELSRLGAKQVVVSTMAELRRDGWPRGDRTVSDPACAVYFDLAGDPHCMPCDTYGRLADNIAAIAEHVKATRAIARYGVATLAEMFAGFLALPSPEHERPWRDVLELRSANGINEETVEGAYRRLARERHPDRGGSDAMMAELNRARDAARRELRA